MRYLIVLIFATLSTHSNAARYTTLNSSCDGLAKLPIGSLPGTCVGLLADKRKGASFRKPRKVVEIPGAYKLLVTDTGGWGKSRGSVWLLDFSKAKSFKGEFVASKILNHLMLPHEIKIGKDGKVYIGEAHQITRFELQNNQAVKRETVIQSLPFGAGEYRHLLTSFIFLKNNNLLVNAGSKTDHCVDPVQPHCDDINEVGLRRYRYAADTDTWQQHYSLFATGLRNSMALVSHQSGTILQAENSTDINDADEPYDEINIIEQGGFYGWPYCLNKHYDQNKVENGCARKNYIEPHSLMPPHVAPLDMFYYQSDLLPMLKKKLIMSWHGYRVVGNRIVAYDVDEIGKLKLIAKPYFNRDPLGQSNTFKRYAFTPEGGSKADAQAIELVTHWNKVEGLRPEGAPVGLSQLSDGSILIVDDFNKSILRLAKGKAYIDPIEKP